MKIAFVYNLQRQKTNDEAEFDTIETVEAIHMALSSDGDKVVNIEMTRDGAWIQKLVNERPDIIFNTAEGFSGIGRESLGPIIFEQLKIPYVGSGPYACFLTLDKFLTKQVVSYRNVQTPEGYYISDPSELEVISKELSYPVFVKPNFEGSSKGISIKSICNTVYEFLSFARESLIQFPEGLLVEKYIEGKDITIPYINSLGENGILEPIEYIGPKKGNIWIYDYELKNLRDSDVSVKCPADISPEIRELVIKFMQSSIQALGVVDFGRADFRVTPSGEVYFIEFNALPSLQPGAGIFEATRQLELTYNETIQKILSASIERNMLHKKRSRIARKIIVRNPKIAVVFNLKRKHKGDPDYELEAEFDSQETINAICNSISNLGHEVVQVEASKDLSTILTEQTIDIVFNIAEGLGKRGREAQVPAVCDLLKIEHTGSDATCLAISLDKHVTATLVSAHGIRTPKSKLITGQQKKIKHNLRYPIIVKPNLEGTSKGIYESSVVSSEEELCNAINLLWSKSINSILCEEYIMGREFTVGVLTYPNFQILGPMEIQFKEGRMKFPVYSFDAKQAENQLDNEFFKMVCPCDLTSNLIKSIKSFAKKCFQILGCRDIARIDFRIDQEGKIYFLEINPLPGLTPDFSDMAIIAKKLGWTYDSLINAILSPAIRRWRKESNVKKLEISKAL